MLTSNSFNAAFDDILNPSITSGSNKKRNLLVLRVFSSFFWHIQYIVIRLFRFKCTNRIRRTNQKAQESHGVSLSITYYKNFVHRTCLLLCPRELIKPQILRINDIDVRRKAKSRGEEGF